MKKTTLSARIHKSCQRFLLQFAEMSNGSNKSSRFAAGPVPSETGPRLLRGRGYPPMLQAPPEAAQITRCPLTNLLLQRIPKSIVILAYIDKNTQWFSEPPTRDTCPCANAGPWSLDNSREAAVSVMPRRIWQRLLGAKVHAVNCPHSKNRTRKPTAVLYMERASDIHHLHSVFPSLCEAYISCGWHANHITYQLMGFGLKSLPRPS